MGIGDTERLAAFLLRCRVRSCDWLKLRRLFLRVSILFSYQKLDVDMASSFPASLAGLLWRDILSQKGLSVGRKEFIRWNTLPVVLTTLVGCLVVAGEVCVMYRD